MLNVEAQRYRQLAFFLAGPVVSPILGFSMRPVERNLGGPVVAYAERDRATLKDGIVNRAQRNEKLESVVKVLKHAPEIRLLTRLLSSKQNHLALECFRRTGGETVRTGKFEPEIPFPVINQLIAR